MHIYTYACTCIYIHIYMQVIYIYIYISIYLYLYLYISLFFASGQGGATNCGCACAGQHGDGDGDGHRGGRAAAASGRRRGRAAAAGATPRRRPRNGRAGSRGRRRRAAAVRRFRGAFPGAPAGAFRCSFPQRKAQQSMRARAPCSSCTTRPRGIPWRACRCRLSTASRIGIPIAHCAATPVCAEADRSERRSFEEGRCCVHGWFVPFFAGCAGWPAGAGFILTSY